MALRNTGAPCLLPTHSLVPLSLFSFHTAQKIPALGKFLPVASLTNLTSQLSLETVNDSSSEWAELSHYVCICLWAKKNHFKTHAEFTLCLFFCLFVSGNSI